MISPGQEDAGAFARKCFSQVKGLRNKQAEKTVRVLAHAAVLSGGLRHRSALQLVKLVGVGANQSMVGGLLWQENRAVPCFMENYEALISVGLVSSIQGRSSTG